MRDNCLQIFLFVFCFSPHTNHELNMNFKHLKPKYSYLICFGKIVIIFYRDEKLLEEEKLNKIFRGTKAKI